MLMVFHQLSSWVILMLIITSWTHHLPAQTLDWSFIVFWNVITSSSLLKGQRELPGQPNQSLTLLFLIYQVTLIHLEPSVSQLIAITMLSLANYLFPSISEMLSKTYLEFQKCECRTIKWGSFKGKLDQVFQSNKGNIDTVYDKWLAVFVLLWGAPSLTKMSSVLTTNHGWMNPFVKPFENAIVF